MTQKMEATRTKREFLPSRDVSKGHMRIMRSVTLPRLIIFFLAAALFSPALVAPDTFFPFTGIKLYWFRMCVSGALITFLLWAGFQASARELHDQLKRAFSSPVVLSVTAFAAVFLLAVIFARDPAVAFWSDFERGEGGFQMLYYYAFFLLLVLAARSIREWQMLLAVAVVAAFAALGYGMITALGVGGEIGRYFFGPSGWEGILAERFSGSLGNPALAGSYLLLSLFFAGFLIFGADVSGLRRTALSAAAFLFFVFLILTQTRGAFLGLIAGIFVFLAHYAARSSAFVRRLALVGLLALLLAAFIPIYFQESSFIQNTPLVGRLARVSFYDRSVQTRLWAWQAAYEGWKERPVFGWGPENFSEVFDRHFDIRHFTPGEGGDTWYDRAHNVLFDYLAETGAAGLLAYLGMFGTFYWQLWRRRALLASRLSAGQQSLLAAFPVAYLAQGMVLFDILPVFLLFFFFLAFAAYNLNEKND